MGTSCGTGENEEKKNGNKQSRVVIGPLAFAVAIHGLYTGCFPFKKQSTQINIRRFTFTILFKLNRHFLTRQKSRRVLVRLNNY